MIYSPPGAFFIVGMLTKLLTNYLIAGNFFMATDKSAAPESFLYSALWGGFLFCVRPGPLIRIFKRAPYHKKPQAK